MTNRSQKQTYKKQKSSGKGERQLNLIRLTANSSRTVLAGLSGIGDINLTKLLHDLSSGWHTVELGPFRVQVVTVQSEGTYIHSLRGLAQDWLRFVKEDSMSRTAEVRVSTGPSSETTSQASLVGSLERVRNSSNGGSGNGGKKRRKRKPQAGSNASADAGKPGSNGKPQQRKPQHRMPAAAPPSNGASNGNGNGTVTPIKRTPVPLPALTFGQPAQNGDGLRGGC